MSDVSYESLRARIRGAPPPPEGSFQGDIPGSETPRRSFQDMLGAASFVPPLNAEDTILSLPLVRTASGWGALLGLAVGAALGSRGGMPGFVLGGLAGLFSGSLLAIGGLVGMAGSVRYLGVPWTLILMVLLVATAFWLTATR